MGVAGRVSIERILCPIDFSDTSQRALAYAAAIANWYDARLTMLYVFANLPAIDAPPLVLHEGERARLMAQMQELAALVPSGVPVDCQVVAAGLVHRAILAQAEATKADMLVLGTHGRSGFQRLFLGSVAEKVIRAATCPTLIVPPRAWDAPVHFHRILCPIDFSDSSLRALERAINLSEEADSKLTLLHVLEMPPTLAQEPFFLNGELVRARETAAEAARQGLNRLVPDAAHMYCTVDTAVVEGRAYREILRQADGRKADLIAMGVQGRGALDLFLFGSTTHHVIRQSTCPVLIVRHG